MSSPVETFDARLTARPGEVLVQFEESSSATARLTAIEAVGGRIKDVINETGDFARVLLGDGVSVEAAIEVLSRIACVRYADAGEMSAADLPVFAIDIPGLEAAADAFDPAPAWSQAFDMPAPFAAFDLHGGFLVA